MLACPRGRAPGATHGFPASLGQLTWAAKHLPCLHLPSLWAAASSAQGKHRPLDVVLLQRLQVAEADGWVMCDPIMVWGWKCPLAGREKQPFHHPWAGKAPASPHLDTVSPGLTQASGLQRHSWGRGGIIRNLYTDFLFNSLNLKWKLFLAFQQNTTSFGH